MIKEYSKEEQNSEVLFIARYDVGKFYADRKEYTHAELNLNQAFTTNNSTTIANKNIRFNVFY